MNAHKFARRIFVVISFIIAACAAPAATIVWTNTGGGGWNTAENWRPNTVPVSGDTAIITNVGAYTVTLDTSPTLNGFILGGTGSTQTLVMNGFTLTLNGASTVNARGVFELNGGNLDGLGVLTINENVIIITIVQLKKKHSL